MAEKDTTLTFEDFKAAWNKERKESLAKIHATLRLLGDEP